MKKIEALPELYSTDTSTTDRPAVKLFDSRGRAFWILWEYEDTTDRPTPTNPSVTGVTDQKEAPLPVF